MDSSSSTFTVSISQACILLGRHRTSVLRGCIRGDFPGAAPDGTQGGQWKIPLASLKLPPNQALSFLQENDAAPEAATSADPKVDDALAIDSMTGWQRDAVLVRKVIVDSFRNLPHSQWSAAIGNAKATTQGLRKLSEGTVYRWIDAYEKHGLTGLVPGYGNRAGSSAVPNEAADIFHSLVLQDKAPSYYEAYKITVGYMSKMHPEAAVPHLSAFMRLYKQKYRLPYRDLARKGTAFYQRNWEYFIPRDCTRLEAGEGWVSDHHQLDTFTKMRDGKAVRPWITSWMDIRTGKMLASYLHAEDPCADHIIFAFYLSVKQFGLPKWVYVDNGKDYRARDVTGCYKNIRPWDSASEAYGRSLFGRLEVQIVFATAYNAQAKTIERQHGRIISEFSRLMPGYAGSNSSKKPESTNSAVKDGDILSYEECISLFDKYITEHFNRTASNGELLKGMCPDEAWEKYRMQKRTIGEAEMKICLMRTSKPKQIDRNGIVDSELGVKLRYWSDWMYPLRGDMVYMRRDIMDYGVAWVWREKDDMFLGKADLAEKTSMRCDTPLEKQKLKAEIARKRRDLSQAKAAIRSNVRLDPHEIIECASLGVAAINNARGWQPGDEKNVPVQYQMTDLGHAMIEEARMQKTGTYDLAEIAPIPEEKKSLYLFSCDKPAN